MKTGIEVHPFVESTDMSYPDTLCGSFDRMVEFERGILGRHEQRPVDVIVGDDVSGRVPTLVTHYLLREAADKGKIAERPQTWFMTSGLMRSTYGDDCETINEDWQHNLTGHAARLLEGTNVKNALVITEIVGTGRSVKRLKTAFTDNGIHAEHVASGTEYLGGHGNDTADRAGVGVEKFPPEPVSRRHVGFSGRESAEFRGFLKDYSSAIYNEIFGNRSWDVARRIVSHCVEKARL